VPIVTREGRCNGHSFALTFPQCGDVTPTMVFNNFKANDQLVSNIIKFACVSERHGDGNWHMHMYLLYRKKMRLAFTHFDKLLVSPEFPEGKRGNYQRVRNEQAWFRYLLKEADGAIPPERGMVMQMFTMRDGWKAWDIEADLNERYYADNKKSKSQFALLAQLVGANPNITLVDLESQMDPAFYVRCHKQISEYLVMKQVNKRLAFAVPDGLPFENAVFAGKPEYSQVLQVLNEYVTAIRANVDSQPPIKGNVIVLWGAANMHKSAVHQTLAKWLPSVTIQVNKTFPFNGVRADLPPRVVIIEQFEGNAFNDLTYAQFESMVDCDNSQIYNAKGGALILRYRPMFIICSNCAPSTWWTIPIERGDGIVEDPLNPRPGKDLLKPMQREALYSRLTYSVKVDQPIMGFPDPNTGGNVFRSAINPIKQF